MAHHLLKSGCNNRPGGALQLRLRQYSEHPSGPQDCLHDTAEEEEAKVTLDSSYFAFLHLTTFDTERFIRGHLQV